MSDLDLAALHSRYPRTCAEFLANPQGRSALQHIVQLEHSLGQRVRGALARGHSSGTLGYGDLALDPRDDRPVAPGDRFDVVIAGGGLSLVYAAALAQAGLRVAVFDRRAIGCGHREWNISRRELAPLCESGLFTKDEVQALVRMQYRIGICRFGAGADHPVRDVLDCVVDAEALLRALRDKAQAAGATLIPHHDLAGYRVGSDGVVIAITPIEESRQRRYLQARLLVDALGAQSPHAAFDLLCPTVGGIMDNLCLGSAHDELDPEVGEILVTTEGVQDGEQHIWEGFPAPAESDPHVDARPSSALVPSPDPSQPASQPASRRMTIYLFYYQRSQRIADRLASGEQPLLALYERFFATLPRYKRGALQLVRPTYGYIPGYTRLHPMPTSPRDRVFLVGDAAARHSPLTFCGFGSMIRSFWPITQGLLRAVRSDALTQRQLTTLWQDPPALQVMGGLTLMMMPPPAQTTDQTTADPDWINRLLDTAFGVLASFGQEAYAAFLQDRVDAATFTRFMFATAQKQPAVYHKAFAHLSPGEIARFLQRFWQFRRSAPQIASLS